MNEPQLAELERQAYRTVVDDGLIDILLGLFLLALGVQLATDIEYLTVLALVLAYPLWKTLRTRLIEPRIGHVRLHSSRRSAMKSKKRVVTVILCSLAAALLALNFFLDGDISELRELRNILAAAFFGLPTVVAGILFEIKRLVVYGALLLAAGVAAHLASLVYGAGLLSAGGIVLISGFLVLTRFLRQRPSQPSAEQPNA